MCSIVSKCSSCFMSHWVYDSQQSIWECHTCKTLCIVHAVTFFHIAIVRAYEIFLNHHNWPDCKRICVVAVCCRNISFNCMSNCVHTCMSNKLLRHGFCKSRVNNSNIRCNFKVCNWKFYTFLIICDNRKSCYFCCCTRCWWNCTEMSLCTKFWQSKNFAHIFKSCFRIFIFYPHGFCSIYRRTTTNSNNPVWIKFLHGFSTFHYSFNGRIWFNTFKNFNFHASFFQVWHNFVKEAEPFHASATDTNHCPFTSKSF